MHLPVFCRIFWQANRLLLPNASRRRLPSGPFEQAIEENLNWTKSGPSENQEDQQDQTNYPFLQRDRLSSLSTDSSSAIRRNPSHFGASPLSISSSSSSHSNHRYNCGLFRVHPETQDKWAHKIDRELMHQFRIYFERLAHYIFTSKFTDHLFLCRSF